MPKLRTVQGAATRGNHPISGRIVCRANLRKRRTLPVRARQL